MKPIDILGKDAPETKQVETKLHELMNSGKPTRVAGVLDKLPLPEQISNGYASSQYED